MITTIPEADIPKDYALFYPGENKSGRRTVAISLGKKKHKAVNLEKAKIVILISSIAWSEAISVLVSA